MLEKEDLSINKQAKIIIFSCLYMLGIITFFFDYSLILASKLILSSPSPKIIHIQSL